MASSPSTVGRRVSEVRHRRGLTQKQLADRLGVSLWAVDQLERGSQPPASPLSKPVEPATLSAAERTARNVVLATLTVIVVIRFFTEIVEVLPAAGNFVDIPLLGLLAALVAVRPPERADPWARSRYLGAGLLFLGVATVSFVLNPERVEPGPALVFVYGFLAPLAFFACAHALWPAGQARALSRVLIALGLVQLLVVAAIDLPRFVADGNPDHISGTFGENPYQLVFFLLIFVALLAGAATFEAGTLVARLAPVLVVATFVVIFLAQYRALLLTTATSVVVLGLLLARARGRGALVGAVAIGTFVVALSYVVERYPTTKFAPALAAIRERPEVFVRARLEPFRTVLDLYGNRPGSIATGTGPGTYSSRAWRTFAEAGEAATAEGATAPYVGLLSSGGPYRTDVSEEYVRPARERQDSLLGSAVALAPFSSYSSLLAEVGVLGFLILVTAYLTALASAVRLALRSAKGAARRDALPALALACATAFLVLLQMAFLENWLEVVRVTIPAWILLAVVLKECGARGRA